MKGLIVMFAITVPSFLVGLVAVALTPSFACCSKVERAKANIRTTMDLLKLYRLRHNAYPPSLDALVADGITDEVPYDTWGNVFAYSLDGQLPVVTSRGWGERPDISSNDL